MKKYNIFTLLVMLFTASVMTSCLKDQEDLFDESASKRLSEYLTNVQDVLVSAENGWVLDYYPDRNLSYGGYVYTLKFDRESVEARFENAENVKDSIVTLYKLCNESGPCILFDTYNEYLHYFTTPTGSSGPGGYQAYDGDHMLLVLGISEDKNTITLKGTRSGNVMYMHRLTNSPVDYLNNVLDSKKGMRYKKYILEITRDNIVDTVMVRNAGGVMLFSYMEDSIPVSQSVAYIYSPEGLKFHDPIEVLGHTIEGISKEQTEDGKFLALNDSKLKFEFVIPNLNEQFVDGEWYISYSGFSAYGQKYYNYVKQGQENIGEVMNWAYVGDYDGTLAFVFNSSGYGGSLSFDYELVGKNQITMVFAMAGTGDGVWYHNNANYAYALFPFGYSAARTFTITADNEVSPSYLILTEDENPDNVIKLSADPIADPLNH